eukprot:788505-Pyramimonas_sp.AAC.1
MLHILSPSTFHPPAHASPPHPQPPQPPSSLLTARSARCSLMPPRPLPSPLRSSSQQPCSFSRCVSLRTIFQP